MLTSQATANVDPLTRLSMFDRSIRSRRTSASPPTVRSRPSTSRSLAPRACAMPAPASLVALPPIPTMNLRNPSLDMPRTSSPSPYVVASRGFRASTGTRWRPDVWAVSTTAVVPSPITPQQAATWPPSGPVTLETLDAPPDAPTRTSNVSLPPSATGANTLSASGSTRRTPSLMASAASWADMLPLKACGAMTTLMAAVIIPAAGR